MGMTTPYEGFLAPELTAIGFPPGFVDNGNAILGCWYVRTYRTQHTEVEVNEQSGDVRVSRLAPGANDANGWPWLYTTRFDGGGAIPPYALAAWALLIEHSHPDHDRDQAIAAYRPRLDDLLAAFPAVA